MAGASVIVEAMVVADERRVLDSYVIAYKYVLCALAYTTEKYATAYIDALYAIAYDASMKQIVRTAPQMGEALRRVRRADHLTQAELGQKMGVRQATVSRLESGERGTELGTLMDALAALNLELVIRPRAQGEAPDLEDLF